MAHVLNFREHILKLAKGCLNPKANIKSSMALKRQEYLAKAKTMFEELDLQWDLDELERLDTYTQI